MTDLSTILPKVKTLLTETGEYIQSKAGQFREKESNVAEKYLNNLVTEIDKESEHRLIKGLSDILPESGFIAEEGTVEENDADWKWIIDPIDGTTNFIHQIPSYSISVALAYKSTLKLAAVLELNRNEMFTAIKGQGAYLNAEAISVSNTEHLKDTLLATGFPYFKFEEIDSYINVFSHFMQNTRGLRRLGSAAIDLCYVACGKFDGYFEFNLSPWDIAGGVLIVKEAGGIVSDFSGGEDWLSGKSIIAANPKVYGEMLEVIGAEFEFLI